jgi:sugar/nucleoside kinase (ribokinase family)
VQPLAVIGNVALDRVAGRPPRIGGPPFYAARALRLLNVPARIVTKSAAADRPLVVPRLAALGVPVAWREAAQTAAYSFSYADSVRTMAVDALGDPWTPEEARDWVAGAVARAQWLHVGALYRDEFPAATLAVLARGRRLLFDGQGIVRPPGTGPLVLGGEPDAEVLRHVTVLKLAEEEAEALLGGIDEAALRSLGVPEVIVTFAERGSLILANGRLERVTAHAIFSDPTGAGDAFAAAYIVSRNAGNPPSTAARRATALVGSMLAGRRR